MDCAALPAALDMTTKGCSPAQFGRGHHAALDPADPTVVSLNIGWAMAAEDIRHFQRGAHDAALSRAAPPPGSGDRTGSASS